jgi:hypothetical protein
MEWIGIGNFFLIFLLKSFPMSLRVHHAQPVLAQVLSLLIELLPEARAELS